MRTREGCIRPLRSFVVIGKSVVSYRARQTGLKTPVKRKFSPMSPALLVSERISQDRRQIVPIVANRGGNRNRRPPQRLDLGQGEDPAARLEQSSEPQGPDCAELAQHPNN